MESGIMSDKLNSISNELLNKNLKACSNEECYEVIKEYVARLEVLREREDKYLQSKLGKKLYYISAEFLIGKLMSNNLINLGVYDEVRAELEAAGKELAQIEEIESEASLGNGGLGRLAACFLDSLATLEYPAYGCGIRYKYGMFKQEIKDGYQVEVPDNWLKDGNPFEIKRSEYRYEVKFGGYVRSYRDEATGRDIFVQEDYRSVIAVPYDLPVIGYGNNTVNSLRIWDAEPVNTFNLSSFDKGDYQKAIEEENLAKNIVEVLYPNDNHYAGKELRLKQQYFFVSASVQRAVERYKNMHNGDVKKLYEKVTFQLNDCLLYTSPSPRD